MLRLLAMVLMLLGTAPAGALTLRSRDVADGKAMQRAQIYPRCGGRNISLELDWSGAPAGTKSSALTMIDPAVEPSGWSHWIVVDMPPTVTSLRRGATRLPAGARGVASNFGGANYNGPCPPSGSGTHSYRVTIWALPVSHVSLARDAKASEIIARLEGIALGQASLTAFVRK